MIDKLNKDESICHGNIDEQAERPESIVLVTSHDLVVHAADAKTLKGMLQLTLQHTDAELLRVRRL